MDADRVALDEFNTIAQAEEYLANAVKMVGLQEFIDTEEEAAAPLIGTADETILPAGGMMLMYGDGGAGKTTLTVDAVCHIAAGQQWLTLPVERPIKVTLIENEGPRAKFRQMLAKKATSWNGRPSFVPNVHVLEEPWTRFTLQLESHRQQLALHVTREGIDVVVMGPLATLGMVGGGTPDEILAFEALLGETRVLIEREVAFWVIHHENKAGDVSGAWERVPDTLCHVQAQGNGHTRIYWRKARWSSEYHGTTLDLAWIEGRSYQVKATADRDYHAELLDAATDKWLTVDQYRILISGNKDNVRDALNNLHERGELEFMVGPPGRGRTARCYRLNTGSKPPSHPEPPDPLWASESPTGSLPPLPVGGREEPVRAGTQTGSDSTEPAQNGASSPDADIDFSPADDDIPF
jgi:hypothetical protein